MHVPTMNFDLGEEIDMLRQSVAHFASAEIAPLAAKADEENLFPHPLWRKLGEQGLLGLTVEEEYGGSGMGYLAHVVAMEEISRASGGIGLSYGAHSNLCVNQLRKNGTEEQKQRFLPGLCSGGSRPRQGGDQDHGYSDCDPFVPDRRPNSHGCCPWRTANLRLPREWRVFPREWPAVDGR
jgi:alkylation response protein AidB-like acyl-CoA dehydrogenase